MEPERTMIRFDRGRKRFNFRSASVVIEEGWVLLHQVVGDDFWALPGGRVEFFEFSYDTAVREVMEETGLEIETVRPLWFVESFFTFGGRDFHEVGHYFLTKLKGVKRPDFEREFKGVESNVNLVFKWFKLAELEHVQLYPKFLRLGLSDIPAHPCHVASNERETRPSSAPDRAASDEVEPIR